jgi:hypothetical protein
MGLFKADASTVKFFALSAAGFSRSEAVGVAISFLAFSGSTGENWRLESE